MSFTIICENNEKERCVMGIIETLQAEIQALKDRVERLESKWAQEEVEEATRQLTRDDIIEMAKRDVAELSWEDGDGRYYVVRVFKCNVEFVINRKKRTVVALLKWRANGRVLARGIAKCHPDDCFNAAIGRAIALRRVLGIEVPDEYLNAPQPTEVRVGDIIQWEHVDCDYQVISLENKFPNVIGINRDGSRFEACGGNFYHHGMKIIDDSREEV
jgi:hypothetical protein